MKLHEQNSKKGCVEREEVYDGKLCLHRTVVKFVPGNKICFQERGMFHDV